MRESFEQLLRNDSTLVATSYVVSETMGLVQRRLGMTVLRRFVDDMLPLIHIFWVDKRDHAATWQLVSEVNKRSFTLVDASSAIFMEMKGARQILTLDPEFSRLGFDSIP